MENLKIERTEGRLSPRYRVIIADMDKGEVVLDKKVYAIAGGVVEPELDDYHVYGMGYHGRCPAEAYPWLIRAIKASVREIKRIWKEARRKV